MMRLPVLQLLMVFVICVCVIFILHTSRAVYDDDQVKIPTYHKPIAILRSDSRNHSNQISDNDPLYLKPIEFSDSLSYKPVNIYTTGVAEKFTIVIQTYNRTDLLMRVLNHYSALHDLHRILVVWNNIGEDPPLEWWTGLDPHPVDVIFLKQEVNNVRNRIHLFPEIRTEAVLLLDDDRLIATQDIQFAFRVWKQFRNMIVGFVPRKHVMVSNGVFIYGDTDLSSDTHLGGYVYSLILTGAAFLHQKYLEMFNSPSVPYGVHQLIDEKQNCEDIAMNFIVGRYLAKLERPQCVGIYIHPTISKNLDKDAVSGYTGLWRRPEHMAVRSYCINKLARLFNGVPLQYCDMVLSSYFDYNRIRAC